jgi:uncharacterized protein (DUF2147 family)
MPRHRSLIALAAALALARSAAVAAPARDSPPPPPPNLLGQWLTQDGNGVIAIEPCGDALCGRIVGIVRAPAEPIPTDVHGASQCGLTILRDEKPTEDGFWLGDITDPRDGKTYGAKIWLDANGDLNLRGFLGIPLLGHTQTWRRFTGHLTAACGIG